MSLRKKIVLSCSAALIGLMILVYPTIILTLVHHTMNLETEEVKKETNKIKNILKDQIKTLDKSVYDYANWDESYTFVTQGDPDFITKNLSDEVFENFAINLVIIVDTSGAIVFARCYDDEEKRDQPTPINLTNSLSGHNPLLSADGTNGFVAVNDKVMLIASRPIRPSDLNQKELIGGYMLWGKYFDDADISRVKFLTDIDIELLLNFEYTADCLRYTDTQQVVIVSLKEPTVGFSTTEFSIGTLPLIDIWGTPCAILKTNLPRIMFKQSMSIAIWMTCTFFVIGLICALLLTYLLHRLVLIRLERFSTAVDEVSKDETYSLRVPVDGNDEIARFSQTLNKTLSAFERSQHKLEQERKRYSAVVDEQCEAVVRLNGFAQITFANPSMCQIYGCSHNQLINQDFCSLFDDIERSKLLDCFQEVRISGKTARVSTCNTLPNGETLWQDWAIKYIPETQDCQGEFQLVGRDITTTVQRRKERENCQEMISQSQKLQAIGALSGGIAHNLNNILTPIIGYAQLGLFHIDDDVILQNYFQSIMDMGNRASKIIKQLLIFAQASALKLTPVQVAPLIKRVIDMCEGSFDKRIVIRTEVAEKLPALFGDEAQVEQVIMNLLINARDALLSSSPTNDQMTISIEASLFQGKNPSEGTNADTRQYISIAVRDNGPGINEAIVKRIFEPFFTTKEVGKGVGLGLSTVHSTIEIHGGWIECHNQLGNGTTFNFFIPAVFDTADHENNTVQSALPIGQGSILVIEDEEMNRTMIVDFLQSSGYQVSSAPDGRQGLDVFLAQPEAFDVVLLDLNMPAMNGEEVCQRIIKHKPSAKIIIMTGYLDTAALPGVKIIIRKPFSLQKLLEGVSEVMSLSA